MDNDFDFFLQNMETLYQQHGQKFVAIKDHNILGAYDSFNEALETTLEKEKLGTFLIQECFESREKLVHHFQGNVIPVSALTMQKFLICLLPREYPIAVIY